MDSEDISITVPAAGTISATYWPAREPRALVLLHPATGVPQGYYQSFARYLTDAGLSVLTYDYRGIGRSRPFSLRDYDVRMSDWIDHDVPAVTAWARERFPQLPLLAIGHSVGGHAIALSPSSGGLRAAVMVASHAGASHTIKGWAERLRVRFIMRVLAPVLVALKGYMPNKRLGFGEDLPGAAMTQWRRWTTLPRYFFDDPAMAADARMAQLRIPLLVVSFDDDPWANASAVQMLISPLKNAQLEHWHLNPRDVGLTSVGHMGFFKKRSEQQLWGRVANWLLAAVPE
ncbi:Predicted alpha/beta hydrolase [Duganella sp. CF517]|uniref:alpha/beta hydrolase family protein n=1 Tax=Duganella sp. CF517 TaxID=1881038 RepID=UPI0008D77B1C|nr:alpha/beta fold hydrolase [Duganella sp. CF517]SEO28982.1 Predicted alpha/beta hydrolase [Duganella sp. CF517]